MCSVVISLITEPIVFFTFLLPSPSWDPSYSWCARKRRFVENFLKFTTGQNLDLNLAVKMASAMASALVVWNFCRTNRLFAASHLRGKKPPCWRAKVALGQDKQKTYLILNSNFLCCLVPGRLFLSSTAVLFCTTWMASYKGPISGF